MLTLISKVIEIVPNCKSDSNRKRNVGYIHVESLHSRDQDKDRIYIEVDGSSPYYGHLKKLKKGMDVTVKFTCKTRVSDTGSGVVFNNLQLVSLEINEVVTSKTDLLTFKQIV